MSAAGPSQGGNYAPAGGSAAATAASVGAHPSASDLAPVPGALDHLVSTAPFDPTSAALLTPEQERLYLASQWMLMWW